MAIMNAQHVKGLRESVHVAIQVFSKHLGLGDRDIDGGDAVTGIAMALRDIIQSSPDAETRQRLAAQAIEALKDAGRTPLIIPARQMPRLHS